MLLFIVSCVYLPEPMISAQTSAQIAGKMAEQGHQVKVLAPFPSRPKKKMYPQYKRGLLRSEISAKGYEIIRCFSIFSSVSSLWSRFFENFSFGLSVFWVILFSPRADIVYGNTWPIFSQGLLMLACKLRHMPLILSIQDIYPESLMAQNRMGNGTAWYSKILRWMDIWIARNCQSLIVISEQFKRIYVQNRGIQEEKIHVIPNWIDNEQASVDRDDYSIRQFHNIPKDAFLVVYGGNIGVAAGVDAVIGAFQHLLDKENIYLLIAGDGSMLPECRRLAEKNELTRVKFHNPWLEQETFAVLRAADLLVLPTHGEQAYASVPSKLLSYMLSGRCILAVAPADSEVAGIISSSSAGWVMYPAYSDTLATSIKRISELLPEERIKYGRAGQDFSSQHYSKEVNLAKVVNLLSAGIESR